MKTKYTIPVMVSTAVLLAACGGGSSNLTTPTPTLSKPSFNLTGTVPGTLIEAFCEDGSHYSTNSESNGTNQHPFTLELPSDLSCRLVMTTNEDDPINKIVTPIRFVNSSGVSSIAFSSNEDIDLDFIDLALTRAEMHSDENQDGVEDTPKDVSLNSAISSDLTIIIVDDDPLDDDKDGIINLFEDDDNDQVSNVDDDDDDGDGILDIDDDDHDNDGIDDNDNDQDGIVDSIDVDDDNDGIKDEVDSDDDNDGIEDEDEIDDDSDHEDENESEDDDDVSDDGNDQEENTDDSNLVVDESESDHEEEESESEDESDLAETNATNDDVEDESDEEEDEVEDSHESDQSRETDEDEDDDEREEDEDSNDGTPTSPPSGPIVTTPSAGRLLASQCAQCHRTDANPNKGFEDLIGEEIAGDLFEMIREGKLELMHLQAKGYNEEQIRLMDDYFNNLSEARGGE